MVNIRSFFTDINGKIRQAQNKSTLAYLEKVIRQYTQRIVGDTSIRWSLKQQVKTNYNRSMRLISSKRNRLKQ